MLHPCDCCAVVTHGSSTKGYERARSGRRRRQREKTVYGAGREGPRKPRRTSGRSGIKNRAARWSRPAFRVGATRALHAIGFHPASANCSESRLARRSALCIRLFVSSAARANPSTSTRTAAELRTEARRPIRLRSRRTRQTLLAMMGCREEQGTRSEEVTRKYLGKGALKTGHIQTADPTQQQRRRCSPQAERSLSRTTASTVRERECWKHVTERTASARALDALFERLTR